MKAAPRRPAFVPAALIVLVLSLTGCGAPAPDEAASGPRTGAYLGETPPGPEPAVFAPGLVSTGLGERDMAMTPDGDEIYYTVVVGNYAYTAIAVVRRVDGIWQDPQITSFTADPVTMDIEPCICPDGSRFYFASDRHRDGSPGKREDTDIWAMDREGDGWGEPHPLPAPVNSEVSEFFPSVTGDGTLYFTRDEEGGVSSIYRARPAGAGYAEPERLPEQVNAGRSRFNAYVAPDESYVIVPVYGREDSHGSVDYYITFRDPADVWTEPVNLGDRVNTEGGVEYSPYVSPDGRFFFFMTSRTLETARPEALTFEWIRGTTGQPGNGSTDIYWMEAAFLEALRPH